MPVQVIFFTPKGLGSVHAPVIGAVRAREAVTIPGSTTTTALDGEAVVVLNEESAAVLVASGSAPNAVATAATAATTAGYPVEAGKVSVPFMVKPGDKIHIADVP